MQRTGSLLLFLLGASVMASCGSKAKPAAGPVSSAVGSGATTTDGGTADGSSTSVASNELGKSVTVNDIMMSEAIVTGQCKDTFAYDPTKVGCYIKNGDGVVWKGVQSWSDLISKMNDQTGSWLGPVGSGATGASCPDNPAGDKTIFISHFVLTEATRVAVQGVLDDKGTIQIWKNADSKQVQLISAESNFIDQAVLLGRGFYSVIIENKNTPGSPTGTLASITDATTKAVILQTDGSANWCSYQVSSSTDTPSFVNTEALCQPCLTGKTK